MLLVLDGGDSIVIDLSPMKAFVNGWLTKIYADGVWAQVWKETIGTVVTGDAPTPPTIGSAAGS